MYASNKFGTFILRKEFTFTRKHTISTKHWNGT